MKALIAATPFHTFPTGKAPKIAILAENSAIATPNIIITPLNIANLPISVDFNNLDIPTKAPDNAAKHAVKVIILPVFNRGVTKPIMAIADANETNAKDNAFETNANKDILFTSAFVSDLATYATVISAPTERIMPENALDMLPTELIIFNAAPINIKLNAIFMKADDNFLIMLDITLIFFCTSFNLLF